MESPSTPTRRHRCETCGEGYFEDGGDGFFYCEKCGSQSWDLIVTAADEEDVGGVADGALYNICHSRAVATSDHRRSLSYTKLFPEGKPNPHPYDFNKPSEPQDFGGSARKSGEPEEEGRELRLRYVQGLQVMLQLQCEATVKIGASPMICGIAGTVWLRHLAASRILDDNWVRSVLAANRAKLEEKRCKSKGERGSSIWFCSLRKAMPVYTTLAITFLACHLAREAVLPTDIVEWALDGKLPYLTAYIDIDNSLGSPVNGCVLSSRSLFRPVQVLGAWPLEVTAGFIAQGIGLRLPSVNFYLIARRYLGELCLPVDKILPHACQIYEWSMPAELWLSSNEHRLPTRICVMAILIVAIRILCNIHGQGTWERSLLCLSGSSSHGQGVTQSDTGSLGYTSESKKSMCDSKQDHTVEFVMPKNLNTQSSGFGAEKLLDILETGYDKLSITYDHAKDLQSYVKYCADVFTGMTESSSEEKHLIAKLWKIYNRQEDDDSLHEVKIEGTDPEKRTRDAIASYDAKKPKVKVEYEDTVPTVKEQLDMDDIHNHSGKKMDVNKRLKVHAVVGDRQRTRMTEMKADMEENGFQYLPPRVQLRTDGYLHYKRQKKDGKLIFVAHADYYILLRSCAKLAKIDMQTMHMAVLRFEQRLAWLEQNVHNSLNVMQNRK